MRSDIRFTVGKVVSVGERFIQRHVSGAGKDAKMEQVSIGWFVTIDNGVSYGFGRWKPDCEVDDTLTLEFRRSRHDGDKT